MDSVGRELDGWLALTPDADAGVEAARQRIGRIARGFVGVLAEVAAEQGVSLADVEALSVIVRSEGPCTPSRLSDELGLTSGTVSIRLARLTEAGLIRPVADTDGRSRPVAVTRTGRALWRRVTAARVRRERELFDGLGARRLADLNRTLTLLLERVEDEVGSVSRHDDTRTAKRSL